MKHKEWLMAALILCAFKMEGHEDASPEEMAMWTKTKTEFANLQLKVAGPGTIQNFVQVAGKVTVHPDHLAYVIPRVNGSVSEVRKNLGEQVEKGEVLALIESQEIAAARAAYLVASKKYAYQSALLDNERRLQGIASGQDLMQAELEASQAEIQLKLAAQTLFSLGLTQEEIEKIVHENPANYRHYALKAPFNGKVLQRNLTVGEWVDTSKQVFTVGNFEKVWVELNLSPADLVYLKAGLPVEIASAYGKMASVKISQFTPTISEETRMATAIALIENSQEEWIPGQFVTARIETEVAPASIVVPLAAIQMIKGEQCVFIENGEEFTPCIVKLGKVDRHNAEIVTGLAPGTTYAAGNTFCLKADYEKEEAEHHH